LFVGNDSRGILDSDQSNDLAGRTRQDKCQRLALTQTDKETAMSLSTLNRSLGALSLAATLVMPMVAHADAAAVEQALANIESSVIAWRHDIHQHPELGNREVRTGGLVADHLQALGLDVVKTGVAHTGVVGVLKGGKPGPVVALRADMDGLPVTEQVDIPFASKATAQYHGREVGVMHACGHDAHTAILMGAAQVLAENRENMAGTVLFLFQPAEEGVPAGQNGGAKMMLEEGAFADPKPDVVFGLHTAPITNGVLSVRKKAAMAGSDRLSIIVTGKQTHGAMPEMGVDAIAASAQIIIGLQTMVARQMGASSAPSVVSIGKIEGGVRGNIVTGRVEMLGTIRHLNPDMHEDLLNRIRHTAETIAESVGATAEVSVRTYAPVVFNDPALVDRMLPSLKRSAKDGIVLTDGPPAMGAEDFAYLSREVPGMYFHIGTNKPGVGPGEAAPNHSPLYFVDDTALLTGVRAMVNLTLDYMAGETE
jgi:amidohydrolase